MLLVPLSCASKHDSAPPLGTCGGQGCLPISGESGQPQASGGNSGAVADAGNGVSLTVNAVAFANPMTGSLAWSLSSVKAVSEVIKVQARAVDGTISSETGSSPVVLGKVDPGAYAWLSVAPANASSIYLPTLIDIADRKTTTLDVPLLLKDDFSFVAGLFTQSTLSLDASQAQLALRIEDSDGNGVRNARIVNPGGATVAYANSGAWIDTSLDPFTDASGRVTVINLPAPQVPGTFVTVTAYAQDSSGTQVNSSTRLPIEAGFVSYGTILLQLR